MSDLNNPAIGQLAESSLHAALKSYYAPKAGDTEVEIDGYLIDIATDNELIEVQTRNFGSLRAKLELLLQEHVVRVVYPVIERKTIVRASAEGEQISKRRSPKRGRWEEVFNEALRIPDLAIHPNFRLTICLLEAEEYWIDDGKGSWRRKGWSIGDRTISRIVDERTLASSADYLTVLPEELPRPFTNAALRSAMGVRARLAGKITYTLRKMGLLTISGQQGRAHLFEEAL